MTPQTLSVGPNHLLRMLPRSLSELSSRQHTSHFLRPLVSRNLPDSGLSPPRRLALLNHIVVVGKSSDLRQVSNAKHLIPFGERLQFLSHSLGRASPNAGINLVKDKC